MSASMLQAVLASDLQPLGLRTVAMVLAWHANEATGHIWASLGTMASEAGISRDRVKQVIRLMIEQGVLEKVVLGGGGKGPKSTSTYAFSSAWVGEHGYRAASLPGKQAVRIQGTREPVTGNDGPPNIDERASPFSSIDTARASVARIPRNVAAARPKSKDKQPLISGASEAPAPADDVSKQASSNSQQPQRLVQEVGPWWSGKTINQRDAYNALAEQIGMKPWDEAAAREGSGEALEAFLLRVIAAKKAADSVRGSVRASGGVRAGRGAGAQRGRAS